MSSLQAALKPKPATTSGTPTERDPQAIKALPADGMQARDHERECLVDAQSGDILAGMFIELNRSFRELGDDASVAASDDAPLLPTYQSLAWPDLLKLHRVVVLSEAGSGKTEEIRHTARRLRKEHRAAFFLRLEHISTNFETAFEEGTYEEFESWQQSTQEGWLLLDSIDEARLRDALDFESAVRQLGGKLKRSMQRAHILLTGRTAAWRPLSDLALCAKHLPYSYPSRSSEPEEDSDDPSASVRTTLSQKAAAGSGAFTVVALDDLSVAQVRVFAEAKKVVDVDELLEEIERADGWSYTTRPLDLEELLDFWSNNKRIGSRLELLLASIDRRLREPDQNRDEIRPLTPARARQGARLLAAACTLTQQQTIAVPDGSKNVRGLRLDALLSDWSATERATLLQRPIFDEEIYGTVRFHHRSVREYLTAEWFAELLAKNTSRRAIEGLFFRQQYGLEVVPPGVRPVLPWLAVLDQRIQSRTCRIAPEILLSGGDPSRLSLGTRQSILRDTCAHLASGAPRQMVDYAAIQRFAAADLTVEIKQILAAHKDEESQIFLLQMVWQGRLTGALQEAMEVALASTATSYARKVAARAVQAAGSDADLGAIRVAVLTEPRKLDRELIAELLDQAPASPDTFDWICDCIAKATDARKYSVDGLRESIGKLVERVDVIVLPTVVERLSRLLERRPVFERGYCETSKQYSWLLKPAALAVQRLLQERDASALSTPSLAVLHKLPSAREYDLVDIDDSKFQIGSLVGAWPELKFELFWYTVGRTRRRLVRKGEKLTEWWRAHLWPSYVEFAPTDFDRALEAVSSRRLLDDRLVALSLSFKLYVERGRGPELRGRLKAACKAPPQLGDRLQSYLHPPRRSPEEAKLQRVNAGWKRRSKKRAARERRNSEEWRQHVIDNVASLRDPGLEPDAITNAQYYLHNRMRSGTKGSSTWSEGNWGSLEAEFGMDVARAFRDGAVAYWRKYRPALISEGAVVGKTPFSIIFGLAGLLIESSETEDWATSLSDSEVELSFRYAMHELNGFPSWFPSVFDRSPNTIRDLVLTEVDYELRMERADQDSHYLIYDINWAGEWLWDSVSPHLIACMTASDLKNLRNLRHVLNVVQGSATNDVVISGLAKLRALSAEPLEHIAQWYAVWTGVVPDEALPALSARLDVLANDSDRVKVVMAYLAQLVGGRRGEATRVRHAFCTTQHLKTLYLLAHRYVRQLDDIDRSNGGAYSPGPRDHAQDAREHLLSLLRALPGKEAFVALSEIALAHPDERSRPYLSMYAKSKAEIDSAGAPWADIQVREFNDHHERTPSNHRDLFDLAVMRLLDLKGDLEEGDSSNAPMLARVGSESEIRTYIGNWLRSLARGRYAVPQEEELADAKRPDLRVHGVAFDAPVPVELKLADNWTGPALFERLEVQLCGDYLRDPRSSCGVFLLVFRGEKGAWQLPGATETVGFEGLVDALRSHWLAMSSRLPNVEDVQVIGVDLTRRLTGASVAMR